MRILNVEGAARDSERLRGLLQAEGWECEVVRVATEAEFLLWLEKSWAELIVSELAFPGVDGMRMLQEALERRPEVPFVLFTSEDGADTAVECVKRGAADYVLKQRPERLGPAVRRALREAGERKARRREEAALRQSEKLLRMIAETITEVFWMADRNIENNFYVSAGYERIWGRCREELIANPRSFLDAVHPEDLAGVLKTLERQAAGESFDHEYRIVRPDGSVRWIWDRCFPVPDEAGALRASVGVAQDITARKAAEEALRESERQYRQIVELASEGIWVLNTEGRVIFVNEQLARMLGCEPDEMIGRHLTEFIGEEMRPVAEQKFASRLRGITERHEFPLRRQDGETLWAHLASAPRMGLDGKPEGAIAMVMDITARKRAEDEQRMIRERMELALNSIQAGVWELDLADGRVLRSGEFDRIFGYETPRPESNLSSWLFHTLPEDRARVLNAYEKIFRVMQEGTIECRIVRADGAVRWVAVSARPVADESGKAVRAFGLVWDITARKEAEETAREIGQFNAQIIASAREGIVVLGPDLRYQVWNDYMEQIFGVPARDVVGRHPLEVFPFLEENGILEHAEAALRGAAPELTEFRYRIPQTGQEGWVSQLSGPLRNLKGEVVGVISTVREITEQKRLEEDLQQAQKMESIGRLAGGVAHDFNNLLTVILGNCDMLLAKTPEGDARRNRMKGIEQAAEQAADLTRQLLAFSRKQVVQPKRVNLNEIVAEMEGMLRRLVGEDIELTTVLAPRLRPVNVDPGQIQQVLMNLGANARDAIPGFGRILVETRGVGGAAPAGAPEALAREGVMLRVTDDGCGMSKETRQRLFEPFYTTKELGRGTGLGLSTVYGIVRQAEGWIGVESEPGEGSTFTVIFPPAADAAGVEAADRAEPGRTADAPPAREEATILLVEDEPELRRLAAEGLKEQGYLVLEAASGEAAEEMAASHAGAIRLLLTDIVLPRMTGREVAERLARIRPGLQVLYMSGYPQEAIAQRGMLEAGVDYLQKPFKGAELARRVRAALGRRRASG